MVSNQAECFALMCPDVCLLRRNPQEILLWFFATLAFLPRNNSTERGVDEVNRKYFSGLFFGRKRDHRISGPFEKKGGGVLSVGVNLCQCFQCQTFILPVSS